jgi:cyclophilin family peptidyl-prolyl cis-trans isomerase
MASEPSEIPSLHLGFSRPPTDAPFERLSCLAVPTEKRARKRAARQARLEALERAKKRRKLTRRAITVVVLAAIGVGAYVLASASGPAKKAKLASSKAPTSSATRTNSSTTLPPTTTTTVVGETPADQAAQAAANAAAVKAGCPANPYARANYQHYSAPPPMTIDPSKTYTATVVTDVGTFTIALDAKNDPKTVNNFVFLADHGFYNCVIFHRVIPGFMDQTGDPTGTGTGGPGYSYTGSTPKPANPQYPIGSVAMANSGTTSSNGSQFFIVTGPEGESLPPNYTLFGHVTSGMSVVDKINAQGNPNPSANGVPPLVIHRMLRVTISVS